MRVAVVRVDEAVDGRAHHREQPRRRRRPVELSDEPRRREVERRAGRLGRQVDEVVVRLERRRLARPHLLLVVRARANAVVHALLLARPVVLRPEFMEAVRRVGVELQRRVARERGGERRLRIVERRHPLFREPAAAALVVLPLAPARLPRQRFERVRVRRGEDGSEVLRARLPAAEQCARSAAPAGSRRDARREPGLPRRGAALVEERGLPFARERVERGLRRTWCGCWSSGIAAPPRRAAPRRARRKIWPSSRSSSGAGMGARSSLSGACALS